MFVAASPLPLAPGHALGTPPVRSLRSQSAAAAPAPASNTGTRTRLHRPAPAARLRMASPFLTGIPLRFACHERRAHASPPERSGPRAAREEIPNDFTDAARSAVQLAREEARRLGHHYCDVEVLLYGVVAEEDGVAHRVLETLGFGTEECQRQVEEYIGRGIGFVPPEVMFTSSVREAFEMAREEAERFRDQYVGTEHLLLALIRKKSLTTRILEVRGIALTAVEDEVKRLVVEARLRGRPRERVRLATLDQFSTDLTEMAAEGRLDPVVGRDAELDRVVSILSRRTKNNPVLIGEPGVGKTAIVEALAALIHEGDVPEALAHKRLLSLDLAGAVGGTRYRGEFEERMNKILAEVRAAGDVILMIDEVHTLVGAGAAEGGISAANVLKPALARGDVQCIGATTVEEYRKHIEKDAALERRFQPVVVEEPGPEEALEILYGVRPQYEAHHGLAIADEALAAACRLGQRYIAGRRLPDKAIDLIDEAAARVKRRAARAAADVEGLEEAAQAAQRAKYAMLRAGRYEEAAGYRRDEGRIRARIRSLTRAARRSERARAAAAEQPAPPPPPAAAAGEGGYDEAAYAAVSGQLSALELPLPAAPEPAASPPVPPPSPSPAPAPSEVTAADVAEVVAQWTGVPVSKLSASEVERLRALEAALRRRVAGQEEAVAAVARAVRRGRVALRRRARPIASFVFAGPTGSGKTELAKALAEGYFGPDALVRLDMSEYMDSLSTNKMIGSAPGYVGYEEGGQLTEAVRRRPFSVLLFDEIEKAHPEVFDVLLQVLDDGRLTDSKGRTVDFKNTIIIMTSNVAAGQIARAAEAEAGEGEGEGEDAAEARRLRRRETLMEALQAVFRIEFLNRIDEIIAFEPLSPEVVRGIARAMLRQTFEEIGEEAAIAVEATDAFLDALCRRGFDPKFGARPLRRAITSMVEDFLADAVLAGRVSAGDSVALDVDAGGRVRLAPAGAARAAADPRPAP